MQEPTNITIEGAMAAAGSKATWAGATTSATGWLFSSEAGVMAGIIIGLVGLLVNYYFKRREDQRLQAEHDLRMEALRHGY